MTASRHELPLRPTAGTEPQPAAAEPMKVLRAIWQSMRPHQAIKNTLVFLPLFASHKYGETALAIQALLAFVSLSLVASATYVINDIFDMKADKAHPQKRLRPLASGRLSRGRAVVAAAVLLAAGASVAAFLPTAFAGPLSIYVLVTLGYSFGLKRVEILDVLIIAGLFTIRVLAGAAATGVTPSFWLLAFCLFLFLSIALVKRVTELQKLAAQGATAMPGRSYRVSDLPALSGIGIASGFIAVLVVALYVNSPDIRVLYRMPELIWLVCPIGLFIVSRLWLLASRGEVDDDPVLFALRDTPSQLAVCLAVVVALAAR
jgi:4-hydroxybenzoate polyprenyltransferase